MSSATVRRLLRARDLLHAEAARTPTLDELASAAGLSRAHFARQFAEAFGLPPRQYLVRVRLERAKRALAAGKSVTEVCYDLGFESLGTFSASFHRRVGMSPAAFQRAARPLVQSAGIPVVYVPGCFLMRLFEHV